MSEVKRITSAKKIVNLLNDGTHIIRHLSCFTGNLIFFYKELIPIEEQENLDFTGKRISLKLFMELEANLRIIGKGIHTSEEGSRKLGFKHQILVCPICEQEFLYYPNTKQVCSNGCDCDPIVIWTKHPPRNFEVKK